MNRYKEVESYIFQNWDGHLHSGNFGKRKEIVRNNKWKNETQ